MQTEFPGAIPEIPVRAAPIDVEAEAGGVVLERREFTAADPDGNLLRVFYDVATPGREMRT